MGRGAGVRLFSLVTPAGRFFPSRSRREADLRVRALSVRAAASVLAVVHDAPASNPDSPERRPAAPVDVVGAPRLRNPTKTRRYEKAPRSGDFFRPTSKNRGEKRARFDVPSADARVSSTYSRGITRRRKKKGRDDVRDASSRSSHWRVRRPFRVRIARPTHRAYVVAHIARVCLSSLFFFRLSPKRSSINRHPSCASRATAGARPPGRSSGCARRGTARAA